MTMYLGDFPTGKTIYIPFATAAAAGSRVAFSNALEADDIKVYRDGNSTERTSTAGFTVTSAFDSLVGGHMIAIDTSDNTDAGFYAAGHDYQVFLYPDETVDSLSVAAALACFSIDNRQLLRPTTASRTLDVSAGGEAGVDWANVGSPTTTVALTGTTIETTRLGILGFGTLDAGTTSSVTLPSGQRNGVAGQIAIRITSGVALGEFKVLRTYNSTTGVGAPASGDEFANAPSTATFISFAIPAGVSLTSTDFTTAYYDRIFDTTLAAALGSLTVEQFYTKLAARLLGNNSGLTAGAGTVVDKDLAGADALSQDVDTDGNRSNLDLTP